MAKTVTEEPSRHAAFTQVDSERGREGENMCVWDHDRTAVSHLASNLHGVGMYR